MSALSGKQKNAYTVMLQILHEQGLDSLAPQLLKFIKQGLSGEILRYELSQTKEYKKRFAGNDLREKNGLPPLSPAEYLSMERAYKNIFASSGLPASFYNSPKDLAGLIGADLSTSELQFRVQTASQFVQSTDPAVRQALKAYHNIDDSMLVAYYLDPKHSENMLQRTSQEALIGAAALDQGLTLPDVSRADQFIDRGFDANQAQSAYGAVAQVTADTSKLGNIYNDPYSQSDAEDEFLGGLASAKRKREKLAQSETDSFSGSGGVGRTSLSNATGGY